MPELPVASSSPGASGLIGAALVASLRADGIEVTTLVRRPPSSADEHEWLTDARPLDPTVLAGADAVVGLDRRQHRSLPVDAALQEHPAVVAHHPDARPGAGGARAGRRMPRLRLRLGRRLLRLRSRCAPDGDPRRRATRSSPICAASGRRPPRAAGRIARASPSLRTAPVVHAGGVLKPLLLLTRFGVCGPIGRGTQVWPWISLDDEVRAIRHVIDARLAGPVNLTGPTRATANDLGFALAVRMNRPFLLRAPVWAHEARSRDGCHRRRS